MTLFGACLMMLTSGGCAQMRGVATKVNPAAANQQRETRLSFAKAHEQEGNLTKAEDALRQILESYPKDSETKHRLGVILVRRGKTEEGLQHLEEAVAAQPKNLSMRNDLGYAYLTQGELEKAETEFREALEISPKNTQSLNNLALAAGYQGRTQEAYTLFRGSMTEAEAMANLGFIHSQRGEVDLAIQRYSQALSYDPTLRNAADGMIQISTMKHQVIAARQGQKGEAVQVSHQEPEPHVLANSVPTNSKVQQTSWYETDKAE